MTDIPLIDEDGGAFDPPIATDPDTIREEQVRTLQLIRPDWRPIDGALDTHILATAAETSAETRQALFDRLRSEVLTWLGDLFGLPRHDGSPASSTITVTAIDAAGHTVPADTTVWVGDIELATADDLVIDAGATQGQVTILAVEAAAAHNDADATPEIDPLDWIDSVTLDAPLSGGSDPEDDVEYAERMRDEMGLSSDQVIVPLDAAVRARRHPAVGWSYAINLYDASTDTHDVPLAYTVVVADDEGDPLPSLVLDEVRTDLEARRDVNYIVRVVNPTYTEVDVTVTVVPHDGWDATTVEANVVDKLTEVLSPIGWMLPPYGHDVVPPSQRIHMNELIARVDEAMGVDYVQSLAIGDGSADYLDLATPAHLPKPGDFSVTVST